jgi:glycerophosphoryl diester phosphodiesterase
MYLIAHRGYSTRYRENSPVAWRAAAEVGADFVEVDVRFTRDRQLVCSHDPDLARLAGRPTRVDHLDLAELDQIEADGFPVAPRFAAALAAVPPTTGLLLDVKAEQPADLDALSAVIKSVTGRRIVLGLHALDSIRHMRALGHDDILGFVPASIDGPALREAGGNIMRLWERDVSPERVAGLIALGLPVWVTVGGDGTDRIPGDHNDAILRRLADLGVEGVLINDPPAAAGRLG